jgi:F-type H+-transporting ATPase subunit delta
MNVNVKQCAKILYELHKDKDKLETNIRGFAAFLVEQNMSSKAHKIYDEFEKYRKEKDNLISVEVESAIKLDAGELEEIEKMVREKSGKKPEITEKTNPKLLAGLRILVEDTMIDSTVSTKLKNLGKIITK